MSRLQGGSAADSKSDSSDSYGSFFHANVKNWSVSNKTPLQVRFLPAFDDQFQPNDPAFKTSVAAYRDLDATAQWREAKKNGQDPVANIMDVTETPIFTDWYLPVQGQVFFGKTKTRFLSPISALPVSQKWQPGNDPVVDCLNYMKSSKNSAWDYLHVNDPKTQEYPPICFPRTFTLTNVLLEKEGKWENTVLVSTKMSLDELKIALRNRAGRGDPIISENFEEFLFGDVTNPQHGSIATTRVCSVGTAGIKTSCFFFSNDNLTLDGRKAMPVTQEQLAARYDIQDTENVTKLATYDEILDILVKDAIVPMEVIDNACSSYGNISSSAPAARTQVQGTPAPAAQPSVAQNTVNSALPTPKDEDVPMGDAPKAETTAFDTTPAAGDLKNDPDYPQYIEIQKAIAAGTATPENYTAYGNLAGKFAVLSAA